MRRKDGSSVIMEFDGKIARDAAGRFKQTHCIMHNVTERRLAEEEKARLEQQLVQAQKLESIGRLAGGIAHDFNNLLTVINGYSELLLVRLKNGDPLAASLTEIRKAGERAAALTQQLLAFSRKQVVQPKPLNLNSLISDVRDMLRRLVGEDIELITSLEPSLGQVLADPGQIHQVLMNLAANARDAMPGGGRLTIATANVTFGSGHAAAPAGLKTGPYVKLAVSDSGVGMPEEVRQHIFEPFFTTKGEGEGTGLGLATVYGIVRQCHGWIDVRSQPGLGTMFTIHLPCIDAPPAVNVLATPSFESLRGSETILLVEDQAEVRALAAEVLEHCGYHVLRAAMGGEALLLAEQHQGPIHLMLTDLVMPRMTGRELAQRLLPLRPNMRVLFMSGYADSLDPHRGILEPGSDCLSKPFTPDELARKVRSVLGAQRQPAKILVADSDEGVRGLLENVLAGAGYEVVLAHDAARTAEAIRLHAPGLVITSFALPPGHSVPRIIALPGASASAQDADAFLALPVSPDQLLAAVHSLIE